MTNHMILCNELLRRTDPKSKVSVNEAIEVFIVFMRCADILASHAYVWDVLNKRFKEFSRKSVAIAKLRSRWKKLEQKILKSPFYTNKSILQSDFLFAFLDKYKKYKVIYYKNEQNQSSH